MYSCDRNIFRSILFFLKTKENKKNTNFLCMAAYAYNNNQSNNLAVYPHSFVDYGSPENANFSVVSHRPVAAINPNFIPQNHVLVPYSPPVFLVPSFAFPLNQSVLIQMDEERSLSLVQVIFICLFFY